MTKRRDLLALGILGAAALFARPEPAWAAEDRSPEAIGSALLDKYVAAVNAHDTGSFADIHTESYRNPCGGSPNGLGAQFPNLRRIFTPSPQGRARTASPRKLSICAAR